MENPTSEMKESLDPLFFTPYAFYIGKRTPGLRKDE
jgi:hypothetical protein